MPNSGGKGLVGGVVELQEGTLQVLLGRVGSRACHGITMSWRICTIYHHTVRAAYRHGIGEREKGKKKGECSLNSRVPAYPVVCVCVFIHVVVQHRNTFWALCLYDFNVSLLF